MSNTEWKKGYEEGFAAGFKAGKVESTFNYTNFPPVYYGGTGPVGPIPHFSTMADQSPYNVVNTTTGCGTITLTESSKTKKPDLKVIHNLTDHTRIV